MIKAAIIALLALTTFAEASDRNQQWLRAVQQTRAGELWTPLDAGAKLGAWYDASDTNALSSSLTEDIPITDGMRVLQLLDKSGNDRHVKHHNTSGPFWAANPPRLPTDSSKHFFSTNTWMYAAEGVTAFAVISGGFTGGLPLLTEANSGSANQIYDILRIGSTAAQMQSFIRSDDNTELLSVSPIITGLTTNIQTVAVKDTGASMLGALNGTWGSATSYTRSKALTLNTFAVMGRVRNTATGWGGVFHEMIIMTNTDQNLEQKTEGWLAWKWDALNGNTVLVDALPALHPYKNAPPTK